jgi:hypothetical protein
MTFTIRASKDGEIVETVRIGRTVTVAKARGLFKAGWMVQIIDSDGTPYAPSQFDHLLSFDQAKNDLQKTSSQNVSAPSAGDVLIEGQDGQRQQQPDSKE